MKITQALIKKLFTYQNGKLLWKKPSGQKAIKGHHAGYNCSQYGYRVIGINTKSYREHRLIFLYHHGWLPKQLDHINQNKLDNRIENLRPCNHAQNQWNRPPPKNNKTGFKGVSFDRTNQKYLAMITVNNRKKNLGRYKTAEEAAEAYNQAARLYHGEYIDETQSNTRE